MDLDEIQSVQSRERQTDSLQQLRDSFYEEAGEFVRALREERERAAERAEDPFDAPEVTRLSDDIATAEQTLEAVYERRVGKIVKMASLAAADMPTEDEGLTTEERDLFETLVQAIESNRQHVFDVLDGETRGPPSSEGSEYVNRPMDGNSSEPAPEQTNEPRQASETVSMADNATDDNRSDGSQAETPADVSAADAMGSDTDGSPSVSAASAPADRRTGSSSSPDGSVSEPTRRDGGSAAIDNTDGTDRTDEGDNSGTSGTETGVERTTVRITDDVGEILGVDDRAYDLTADDIVTLPTTNADPLIERGAAERLS
ncbi:MAG: hypothetical protein ABEI98_01910 [Halorhabdus sp.]